MIKFKFGDSVRSKTWTAQVNEVLSKVVCHNISAVIQEMFELGIKPKFEMLITVPSNTNIKQKAFKFHFQGSVNYG